MVEIIFAILAFTGIVTGLAMVILVVRGLVVRRGRVQVTVNGAGQYSGAVGDKLLDVLSRAGIRLPSACGGIGTCGQCRIRVVSGETSALPTEASRISRRDIASGFRLACQTMLRQDMSVDVPEEMLGAGEWRCTVRSTRNVATLIREIILDLPAGEHLNFRAGAYIQIDCPPYRKSYRDFDLADEWQAEWDRMDLWHLVGQTDRTETRAYSLANGPKETNCTRLVIRLALPPPGAGPDVPPGTVSSWLFGLAPGDEVAVSGPFGTFFATDSDREMIFIGGGAGMAPMRAHILDQLQRLDTQRRISFWYGARNLKELFYREEFDRLAAEHGNFTWQPALSEPEPDDVWEGPTGFIHKVLFDQYLASHPSPEDCEYYLCGPPMMVKAVRAMLDELGVDPDAISFDDFGG